MQLGPFCIPDTYEMYMAQMGGSLDVPSFSYSTSIGLTTRGGSQARSIGTSNAPFSPSLVFSPAPFECLMQ